MASRRRSPGPELTVRPHRLSGTRLLLTRALLPVAGTAVLLVAVSVQHLGNDDPTASSPDAPTRLSPGGTGADDGVPHLGARLRDVSWTAVGGVLLPASRLHGPRITSGGRAAGYSRSEAGAALAAVQVLLRASPTAGPRIYRPVLASQVTGANTASLRQTLDAQYVALRDQAEATGGIRFPDGAPIPGANARVRGYRLHAFGQTAGTALVEVVLDSPGLRLTDQTVSFTVSLRWDHDDWRALAPPRGDWASTATPLGSVPEGLLSYDDLGVAQPEPVSGRSVAGTSAGGTTLSGTTAGGATTVSGRSRSGTDTASPPAGRERGASRPAARQAGVSHAR